MKTSFGTIKYRRGFSLAEVMMAVVIGSMVMVTMLMVYSRVQASSSAIGRNLDRSQLPSEVLQLIAEDLDPIMSSGVDTKIIIGNKVINGYPSARLQIRKTIRDAKNASKEFETIVWQSSYDYESDSNGLVLYRMHTGMVQEDKLLDEQREDVESLYPFIPICKGVTYFSIQVPRGENFVDKWPGLKLPPGVVVSISFAEPSETGEGTVEVLDQDKFTRTIAVNRNKKMNFVITKPKIEEEIATEEEPADANDVSVDKEGTTDKTTKPVPDIKSPGKDIKLPGKNVKSPNRNRR